MLPLQLLPAALVAFVWASPVFATPPMSTNDLFRALAAQVPRKPDLPVCCLKPLQPLEPLEDEILLSFEEWKQKQSVKQEKERAKEREATHRSTNNTGGKVSGESGNGSDTAVAQDIAGMGEAADADDLTKAPKTERLPPHFRVPLVDRFNYASLECSARVRLSHRSAKSALSILSSKRDRYMLSPCNPSNQEKQFVVVELCEDIRIDTVQLANFEFFSGIFKDFRISVAKTEITGEKDWTDAGLFRAKNVRGIQSFHPPRSLRDFYRYIRIEFLSHYGNEYYCPVSLLRVYGLTHLEEWKWDMWEQESREALATTAKDGLQPPPSTLEEPVANLPVPGDIPQVVGGSSSATTANTSAGDASSSTEDNNATDAQAATTGDTKDSSHTSISPLAESPHSAVSITPSVEFAIMSRLPDTKPSPSPSAAKDIHDTPRTVLSVSISSSSVVSPSTTNISSNFQQSNIPSTPAGSHKASPSDTFYLDASIPAISRPTTKNVSRITTAKATTTIITSVTSSVVSVPAVSHPVVSSTTGGESIYRTIMNRLTALEGNHTLYARYVEQQTSGVRELLRRLGEDVGRLEGIGKAQSQMYQRTVREWEKRQQQLQMDYGELMERVEYLSDEIVLEKRLGIAQLCLLLAVLVFMGLTRGSRGDEHPVQFNRSMREWGRRHLSFSGDWTTRFTSRGRSASDGRNVPKPHPQTARPVPINLDHNNMKVEFPSRERAEEKIPLKAAKMNIRSISSDARVQPWGKPRSRTPSMRNGARQHQHQHQHVPRPPSTPTTSHRPRLQRSNSHGGHAHPGSGPAVLGSMHKSARRWARTAHLHEVRSTDGEAVRRRARTEREDEVVDVFASPGPDPFWARKNRRGREGEKGEEEREEEERKEEKAWLHGSGAPRKGKQKQKGDGRLRFKPSEESEADQWVDTDTDIEDGDADWGLKMEAGGRSMAYSAAGNEH